MEQTPGRTLQRVGVDGAHARPGRAIRARHDAGSWSARASNYTTLVETAAGEPAAQERAKCTSPPFVGDYLPRFYVTDMSSEPARESRLRRPRGGPHASRRAACVELEEDEEKDIVPEDS